MQKNQFNQLCQTRYGEMLVNKNDLYIGKSLLFYGEMGEEESAPYKQMLKYGDNVIEVGANIGIHSLPIAQAIGESGKLFCFEPQRIVFQTLNANLALNSLTNTYTFNQAVGDATKTIHIPMLDYTQEGNFGGFSIKEEQKGESISQITLDECIDVEQLKLLKIDVEGMEEAVIQGATSLINKHKPIIYCENDRQEKSQSLIELLWSLDYQCYWHLPKLYNPQKIKGISKNIFENLVSVNMLFVHKSSTIKINRFTQVQSSSEHPMRR